MNELSLLTHLDGKPHKESQKIKFPRDLKLRKGEDMSED